MIRDAYTAAPLRGLEHIEHIERIERIEPLPDTWTLTADFGIAVTRRAMLIPSRDQAGGGCAWVVLEDPDRRCEGTVVHGYIDSRQRVVVLFPDFAHCVSVHLVPIFDVRGTYILSINPTAHVM